MQPVAQLEQDVSWFYTFFMHLNHRTHLLKPGFNAKIWVTWIQWDMSFLIN